MHSKSETDTHESARVCVSAREKRNPTTTSNKKPPHNDGLRVSRVGGNLHEQRYYTTTTGTLEEHSSSSGRESSIKVPESPGGLDE